ncbi:MAG: hypothetical protein ABI035_01490 [Gemmatimonadaceae bacterium]
MRLKSLALVITLACLSTAAACNRSKSTAATPVPGTVVDVVNQGLPDMNVYVSRTPSPVLVHLGVAAGSVTTKLTIPDSLMVSGVTSLKFFADPVGRVRTSVSSTILVHRGDIVTLTIPAG